MLKCLAGAMCALAFAGAPAWGQADKDVVVVTGSLIQSDDEYADEFGELPYVSVVAPADFVIFTVTLETATRSRDERLRELERTFSQLRTRAQRSQGVVMEVGFPGNSAPLETAEAREAIRDSGDRSAIDIVLRFAVRPNEAFAAVRNRAESFIEGIELSGRVEAVTGEEQYIGVTDPKTHRENLLRKIAEDTRLLQSIFGGGTATGLTGISLTGLSGRVKTRPVGPLELEMFIPYSIVLGAPLPQPPPR